MAISIINNTFPFLAPASEVDPNDNTSGVYYYGLIWEGKKLPVRFSTPIAVAEHWMHLDYVKTRRTLPQRHQRYQSTLASYHKRVRIETRSHS